MRIAWFGAARDGGGVPAMGAVLLRGLLDRGVEVEMFTTDTPDQLPPDLRQRPGFTLVRVDTKWSWNRWYSRTPFRAFLTGTLARVRAHRRLCRLLIQRNRQVRYDCIFQLSQMELFSLGRHLKELPPVVIYPCTHAAGELRWHRNESAYALQSESRLMHWLTRLVLIYRSRVQRREIQKPALILAPSRRFGQLLCADYDVDPSRVAVLRHPIILPPQPNASQPAPFPPIRLLFVSRISVRKGVEAIVKLSKRLDDLADQVRIDLIGDRTQWSDYTAHLKDLNPRIAKYVGPAKFEEMPTLYMAAHGLLVPSRFEPGSLVVGEALSSGLPMVVSDEVGPSEVLPRECCRVFPAGDIDAFEREVRALVQDIKSRQEELRRCALREADEQFSSTRISGELADLFVGISSGKMPAGAAQ